MGEGEGAMKKFVCISIIVFFCIVMAGCTGTDNEAAKVTSSGFDYVENLTLEDVTKTISEAGIELIEIPGAGQDLRLNDIIPSVFSVNRSEETILIYVCPSIGVRKLITPDNFGWEYDDNYLSIIKNCKNVLIIDKMPLARMGPYDSDRWRRLDEAVFKLNDTQETVLCGSSPHWEGKIIVKHYCYWYRDIDGTTRFESDCRETWKIKYRGIVNEVKEVAYTADYPYGSRSDTTHLDNNGYLQLGGSSSNGFFSESGVYNIKIQWNGNEESLDLKKK
jgi:hypothetical protein